MLDELEHHYERYYAVLNFSNNILLSVACKKQTYNLYEFLQAVWRTCDPKKLSNIAKNKINFRNLDFYCICPVAGSSSLNSRILNLLTKQRM